MTKLFFEKEKNKKFKSEVSRHGAIAAFNAIREMAVLNGTADMPLSEINKEIEKVRNKKEKME